MNTPASCSLELVHARDAARTVIFRRGPSKYVRCILWDRTDDSFEDGQWLKGRIWAEKCSLSPGGEHLFYVASKDGREGAEVGRTYAVISRPPYLTALALFPVNYWGVEEAQFLDNRRYIFQGQTEFSDLIGRAVELERVHRVKPFGKNTLGYTQSDGGRVNFAPRDLEYLQGQRTAPNPDVFSEGGRLYRGSKDMKELVRDFTNMTFEPIKAPYDWRSGNTGKWHPLDGEE